MSEVAATTGGRGQPPLKEAIDALKNKARETVDQVRRKLRRKQQVESAKRVVVVVVVAYLLLRR